MQRALFISISATIIFLALALEHVADVIHERRDELIQELDAIIRLLDQEREQKNELEQRNQELEEALLSRGGRPDATTMPVTQPSGYSAAMFEHSFAGTGLVGIGESLVTAEAKYGINALVLAGIIAHESGWGTSRLAREKQNLAGLGAYDGQEYSAGIRFDSRASSIMFLAELLAVKYAPGGCYYGGSHDLQGIGARYASDPRWAEKVAGCMKIIAEAGQCSRAGAGVSDI